LSYQVSISKNKHNIKTSETNKKHMFTHFVFFLKMQLESSLIEIDRAIDTYICEKKTLWVIYRASLVETGGKHTKTVGLIHISRDVCGIHCYL